MKDIAQYFLRTPNMRASDFALVTKDLAGGKGSGLLRLPLDWYPATIVVSPGLWTATSQIIQVEMLHAVPSLATELAKLAAETSTSTLLVRSSAQDESIKDRGTYLSVPVEPTLDALAVAIASIWSDAAQKGGTQPIGLLVQPLLSTVRSGHLSNEHRVSRASTQWLLEPEGEPSQRRQVQQTDPAPDGKLWARNPAKSDYQLRAVAKRLSGYPIRMHLEWVWDGARTWVVQADAVPPTLGPPPGEGFVNVTGEKVDPAHLQVWRHLGEDPEGQARTWPKVLAIAEFREADLGGPDFWILTGDQMRTATDGDLLRDLEVLCSGHILIRTDVRSAKLHPNLKRSDVLIDAKNALDHLKLVTRTYDADGGNLSDLCFIAHRFTRARASAWAAAWPNRADVRIDSLWGLADGLQYLPHDTAWVNADASEVQQRATNSKTQFLETSTGSDWDYQQTPTEWIWKSSVTAAQLITIAASTQRVANLRGRPVVVMWFVGVLDGYDADCLAWVTTEGPDRIPVDLRDHAQYPRYTVTSLEDLESFAPGTATVVMRLQPDKNLIRENSFLNSVAAAANKFNAVVEMAGSPLAHAYYQLQKAGVTVVCLDSPESPIREFSKLVRDKIVARVREQGERVVSYEASLQEQRILLKRKLIEEALEVLDAEGEGALLEELADVEEVLTALRRVLGIDRDEVVEVQEGKRKSRGGFDTNSVLVQTGGSEQESPPELFSTGELRRASGYNKAVVVGNKITFDLIPPAVERRVPFLINVGEFLVWARYDGAELIIDIETSPPIDDGGFESLF